MLKFIFGTLLFIANSAFAAHLDCIEDSTSKNNFRLVASIMEDDQLGLGESQLETDEIQITNTHEIGDLKMENIPNHFTNYVLKNESCQSWFVLPKKLMELENVKTTFSLRCGGYPGIRVRVNQPIICNVKK